LRAGRQTWPDVETFGREDAQPEEELMVLKEIYMMNQEGGKCLMKKDEDSKEFLINFRS